LWPILLKAFDIYDIYHNFNANYYEDGIMIYESGRIAYDIGYIMRYFYGYEGHLDLEK
jgi:hypothetical protein